MQMRQMSCIRPTRRRVALSGDDIAKYRAAEREFHAVHALHAHIGDLADAFRRPIQSRHAHFHFLPDDSQTFTQMTRHHVTRTAAVEERVGS